MVPLRHTCVVLLLKMNSRKGLSFKTEKNYLIYFVIAISLLMPYRDIKQMLERAQNHRIS